MFYVTGDTHGEFPRYYVFKVDMAMTAADTVVILGDAGLNYWRDERDDDAKKFVSSFPFATFCIQGNHEMRPPAIPGYQMKEYHGGQVWYQERYPNVMFAKDGEIYDFDGRRCIVIGGAYSMDKFRRLQAGAPWFADEQPSQEIKSHVEAQLDKVGWKIDAVLSHTCPRRYEPTECFRSGIDQSKIDKSTEDWLDTIEQRLAYGHWYCGHYHISKDIDRITFMFKDVARL